MHWYSTPNSDEFTEEDLKSKNLYVLWTGGLDSTMLLYELAKYYGTKEKPVIAISLESANINQTEMEKYCRKRLKKEFKKRKLHIRYVTNTMSMETRGMRGEFFGGPKQPTLVLVSMLMAVSHADSMIFCGYVKGDDIWHFIPEFKSMFRSMVKMVESNATVHFPYEFRDKSRIYDMAKDSGLLPYIWWCEASPDDTKTLLGRKPCGKCTSCRRMNLVQYQYESDQERSKQLEQLLDDVDKIETIEEPIKATELE